MTFKQLDHENTFSELARAIMDIHPGATAIGLLSIVVSIVWSRWTLLKNSPRAITVPTDMSDPQQVEEAA